jgi:hypothetical protein
MSHLMHVQNPFMLMLNPEAVIAAMEASERLKQLNRHECRPLDRVVPAPTEEMADAESDLSCSETAFGA